MYHLKTLRYLAFLVAVSLFSIGCQPTELPTVSISGLDPSGVEQGVPDLIFDYSESGSQLDIPELQNVLTSIDVKFNGADINDEIFFGATRATLKDSNSAVLQNLLKDGVNTVEVFFNVEGLFGIIIPTRLAQESFTYTEPVVPDIELEIVGLDPSGIENDAPIFRIDYSEFSAAVELPQLQAALSDVVIRFNGTNVNHLFTYRLTEASLTHLRDPFIITDVFFPDGDPNPGILIRDPSDSGPILGVTGSGVDELRKLLKVGVNTIDVTRRVEGLFGFTFDESLENATFTYEEPDINIEILGLNSSGIETSTPDFIVDYSDLRNFGGAEEIIASLTVTVNGFPVNDLLTFGYSEATLKDGALENLDNYLFSGDNTIRVSQLAEGIFGIVIPENLAQVTFRHSKSAPRAVITSATSASNGFVTLSGFAQTLLDITELTINGEQASILNSSFENQRFELTLPESNAYSISTTDELGESSTNQYVKRGAFVENAIRVSINDNIIASPEFREFTSQLEAFEITLPSILVANFNPLVEIAGIEVGLREFPGLGAPFTDNTQDPSRVFHPSKVFIGDGLVINSLRFIGENSGNAIVRADVTVRDLVASMTLLLPIIGDINLNTEIGQLDVEIDIDLSVNSAGRGNLRIPNLDLNVEGFRMIDLPGFINFLISPVVDAVDGIIGPVAKDIIAGILNTQLFAGSAEGNGLLGATELATPAIPLGIVGVIDNLMALNLRVGRFGTSNGDLSLDVQTAFQADVVRVPALGAVSSVGAKSFDNPHVRTGTEATKPLTEVVEGENGLEENFTGEEATFIVGEDGIPLLPTELRSDRWSDIDYAINGNAPIPDTSGDQNLSVSISSDMVNQLILAIYESGLLGIEVYLTDDPEFVPGTDTVAELLNPLAGKTLTVSIGGLNVPSLNPGDLRVSARLTTPLELLFSGDDTTLKTDVRIPSIQVEGEIFTSNRDFQDLFSTRVLATAGADLALSNEGLFSLSIDGDDINFQVLEFELLGLIEIGGGIESFVNDLIQIIRAPIAGLLEEFLRFEIDIPSIGACQDEEPSEDGVCNDLGDAGVFERLGLTNIKLSAAGLSGQDIQVGFSFSLENLVQTILGRPLGVSRPELNDDEIQVLDELGQGGGSILGINIPSVGELLSIIEGFVTDPIGTAIDTVEDVVGGVGDLVGDVVGGVGDLVGDVVGGVGDLVGDVVDVVDDIVDDAFDFVDDIFDDIFGGWF